MKVDAPPTEPLGDAHQMDQAAATPEEDAEDVLLEDISIVGAALERKLEGIHQLDGMDGDQEKSLREAAAIGMFLEAKIQKLVQMKNICAQ